MRGAPLCCCRDVLLQCLAAALEVHNASNDLDSPELRWLGKILRETWLCGSTAMHLPAAFTAVPSTGQRTLCACALQKLLWPVPSKQAANMTLGAGG